MKCDLNIYMGNHKIIGIAQNYPLDNNASWGQAHEFNIYKNLRNLEAL